MEPDTEVSFTMPMILPKFYYAIKFDRVPCLLISHLNTFQVRFIRANCARLVVETNQSSKLYYNVDNTREYHEIGEEPNFLELDEETVPSIITLLKRYPKYIKLEELPHEDLAQKMRIAQDLWEKRLLMTKDILEPFKFDDD